MIRGRTKQARKQGGQVLTLLLVMLYCLLLAACGKKEGKVVGSTALPYSESQLLLVIASARQETEKVYGKEIWDKRVSGGRETFPRAYSDELKEFFYEFSAINGMAKEWNVRLDMEEMRRLHEAAERFYTASVQNQPSFGGLSEEEVEFMSQQYARALKPRKIIRKDRGAEVDENEAKVIRLQSAACEKQEGAEKLRDEALAGGDFRTFARKYCSADVPAKKVARGDLAPALEWVAFAMKDNIVSAVTELDGKYYMFKRPVNYDTEATAERRESLQDERLQNLVRGAYERYLSIHPVAENAGLWDSIKGKVSKNYNGSNFFIAVREALRYEGV